MLRVGAGNIQFVRRESFGIIENPDDLQVILQSVPENIGDHRGREAPQQRQFFCNKPARSDVLKADRIDHSRASFPKPGGSVSPNRFARETLYDDSAQRTEVDQFLEFNSIREGARSGNNGISESNPADNHFQPVHPGTPCLREKLIPVRSLAPMGTYGSRDTVLHSLK